MARQTFANGRLH